MDNTHAYCDSNYNYLFDCTNTTYKDADGNAEGDTIFVKTNCSTNERIDPGQDPRYDLRVAPMLHASLSDPSGRFSGPNFQKPTPLSDDTCTRGCYCAYNRGPFNVEQTDTWRMPYKVGCDTSQEGLRDYCVNKLLTDLILRNTYLPDDVIVDQSLNTNISLTSQNITMLKFYRAISCDAAGNHGVIDTSQLTKLAGYDFPWNPKDYPRFEKVSEFAWHWVPDGDGAVYRNPYECFGNLSSNAPVMHDYANYFGPQKFEYDGSLCWDKEVDGLPDDFEFPDDFGLNIEPS
ncbi:MAG: hypothetical protein Q9184_004355 [Pyrenodesmia sp. 2 TL-2023]